VGFVGSAGHGGVRVELSGACATVRVQLLPGWRAGAADRLGPVVLQAFAAALSARLAAQAPPPQFDFTAAAALRALGSGHDTVALVADAVRDLREFTVQLAALHAAPRPAAAPGGRVTATVRGGQIVGLTVDAGWCDRADDTTLAHGLGEALGAGLRLLADTPRHAMAGCPALTAVLRLTGSGELRSPVGVGAPR
jgi:hypothetical protein